MTKRTSNWKYIIREIVIVSIGILLAFFINNWSSKLNKSKKKQEYKKSLIVDIEENLTKLDKVLKAQELKVSSLNYVIQSIEESNYNIDTIGQILFKERKSPTFFPIKGTFKALLSHGEIELFSTNLKREIFNLYDTNYERTVYNGALYDDIYVNVYDKQIQKIVDLKTRKIIEESKLHSEELNRSILVIIDEAESYLKLIKSTKSESLKVLDLVKQDD